MLDQMEPFLDQDAENNSATALARKVSFLSRAETYAPGNGSVTVRETHMSWVFMTGERVYKLKKPVRFPYLDFSTLARREAACRAEFLLNRRLAPGIYLGVVALTAGPTGYAIGGTGPVADWLVVMRRLNENETLEAALARHSVTNVDADQLAAVLARFYSCAARVLLDPESHLVSLHKAITADRSVLLNAAFDLPRGRIDRILSVQFRFLRERRKTLTGRVHRRHILDAHGDLRPEHIWLSNPFPIIDCLEFSPRLRALDALDEIAFLHLECERLGGRPVGDRIRRRLARVLDDDPDSGLFLFYRIGRAMLRARLSIAHLADPHPRTPEKWPRLARSYLALAEADAAHLRRILSRKARPRRVHA
jgi:uncharacterized protein